MQFLGEHGVRADPDAAEWFEQGEQISEDLAAVVHGEPEHSQVERAVREWQAVGRAVSRRVTQRWADAGARLRETGMSPEEAAQAIADGRIEMAGLLGDHEASEDEPPQPGPPLDLDAWLSDAGRLCINDFEPFTERLLELATLDRLGILSMEDHLLGGDPNEPIEDDAVVAVSNARRGYALRNRELQLVERADYVAGDDALASLVEERAGGDASVNLFVIHGVLRDVLLFQFLDGGDRLYETTPGTTPDVRREAIGEAADPGQPGGPVPPGACIR